MPPMPPMPPMGQPEAGGMADMRSFRRRRAILAALTALVLAGVVAAVVWAFTSDDDGGGTPAAVAQAYDGTVYIQSNRTGNANSILAYRYREGSFSPLSIREYPTGGSGAQDLTNAGGLDAEGQIAVNEDQTRLYTVNSGSDTIAGFNIHDDGSLSPIEGSPFPSGGQAPASVTVAGDELFVANKAQDGVRDLSDTPASYVSFHINTDGSLSPLHDPVQVPPGSSPTQVYNPPGSDLIVSTELPGPWRVFKFSEDGKLTQVPDSPHPLEREVFAPKEPRKNVWAQGISKHPDKQLLYAAVANERKLVVYSYDDEGRLELVHTQPDPGASLPCWTAINEQGTRLYTGNAGSQNISVYDIGTDASNPVRIQRVTLRGEGNPWNFQIDPSGRYLFMLNMRAIERIPAGRGNTLHSFAIGGDGKLSELPSSPVQIPVPLGTNPWGMAVVPRR